MPLCFGYGTPVQEYLAKAKEPLICPFPIGVYLCASVAKKLFTGFPPPYALKHETVAPPGAGASPSA
jgi:hypothetical protein